MENRGINKIITKIVSLAMILVLVFTMNICPFVYAASGRDNPDFKLVIKNVDMENRSVLVDVVSGKDADIAAGAFTIGYNENHLTYKASSVNWEALTDDVKILVNERAGEGEFIFSYLNINPFSEEKVLMTLEFQVAEGYYGMTTISVSSEDAADNDFQKIELAFHNLTFEIPQKSSIQSNPFNDLKEGYYYINAVVWAVKNGITAGVTATQFNPEGECTRGQVVTFLWRAMWKPQPGSTSGVFTDLEEGYFYEDAVLWAYENGITAGTSQNTFSPNNTVTRGQFVTFLWRLKGKPSSTVDNPFEDVSDDLYYTPAILWAYENGITAGTSATTFEPDKVCLRQEVVTFLYRAFN